MIRTVLMVVVGLWVAASDRPSDTKGLFLLMLGALWVGEREISLLQQRVDRLEERTGLLDEEASSDETCEAPEPAAPAPPPDRQGHLWIDQRK